jgi:hypothetical protein
VRLVTQGLLEMPVQQGQQATEALEATLETLLIRGPVALAVLLLAREAVLQTHPLQLLVLTLHSYIGGVVAEEGVRLL